MRVLLCLLITLFFLLGCTQKCKYPVYFQVSYVDPNSVITLDIDSGMAKRVAEFQEGYYMEYNKRYEIINAYCSSNDLIDVRVGLNSIYDTVFVVNPARIKGCFIGTNSKGKIKVFYDYYEGGLRGYSFED